MPPGGGALPGRSEAVSRPFVLLATRDDDVVADAEYAAFCELGGLAPHELIRVRLEREPMPRLDLATISGILVGGSPFTSSDPVAAKSEVQVRVEREISALLDDVVERDFPYLGACYGVGTLGCHIGARIDRTYAEGIGAVRLAVTVAGRTDPVLSGVPDVFDAYVGHKEAVRELPAHAEVLVTGKQCPVQMFRVGRNVYATQFHPELTRDSLLERVIAYDGYGYYNHDDGPALLERIRHTHAPHPATILRNFVDRYRRV